MGVEARHEQRRNHKDYDASDRLGSPEGPENGGIEEEERDEVPPIAYSYRPNQGSRNASINGEDRRDRSRVGESLASADMVQPEGYGRDDSERRLSSRDNGGSRTSSKQAVSHTKMELDEGAVQGAANQARL